MAHNRSQNVEPLASMSAEWLLQENKAAEINLSTNDIFGRKELYASRPEQWTVFTDGFRARGGVGGFYICNFNDEEKPHVSFIQWKNADNKDVRVTGIKPVSQGRFVAVVEEGKEDILVILDAKSEDPSKPIASAALDDARRGSDRNFIINIAIYDSKPESFKLMVYRPIIDPEIIRPNQASFQFTEKTKALESIDSLHHRFLGGNQLRLDMLFMQDNYICATSLERERSGLDVLQVYSLNEEYKCDDRYVFYQSAGGQKRALKQTYEFYRTFYSSVKRGLTHTASGMGNHYQLYSHPLNGHIILAEDFLHKKARTLLLGELKPYGVPHPIPVIFEFTTITDDAKLFSNPVILPDNRIIYIGAQEESTIFLFDPVSNDSLLIYQFLDSNVEEIFLTPKGNLAVCSRDKEEAVCHIYPIPTAKLTEKEKLKDAIAQALPIAGAKDIAVIIGDYTYQEPQTWTDWVLGKQTCAPITYPCVRLRKQGLFANGLEKALAIDRINNIAKELEDLQQKLRISIVNLRSEYTRENVEKVRDELNQYKQIANERYTELPRLTQLQPHHPELKQLNKLLDDKWEIHFAQEIDDIGRGTTRLRHVSQVHKLP